MTARNIVRLELLREGPPHNQLLSPLTRYIALCNNRPAESFQVDLEHADFVRWNSSLDGPSDHGVVSVRQSVTRILGSIHGLKAELAAFGRGVSSHIHLVLSAAELASLPFELALATNGLPGEGQSLLLQSENPITLTRESRRQATSAVEWPDSPRILLAAASPNSAVPLEAHELALRRAVDPWVGWTDPEILEQRAKKSGALVDYKALRAFRRELDARRSEDAGAFLKVLPRATLASIAATCAKERFTHVHILAHGAPLEERVPGQRLLGVELHHERDGSEVVDGQRLEIALRGADVKRRGPAVVSLAICDSGNMTGGVLARGASVAHDLHDRGVPLVVASQFPLTFPGSAVLADVLYSRLLRGEDPREVVHEVRRKLFQVLGQSSLDWGSIVVYGSVGPEVDQRLPALEIRRAGRALDAAVAALHAEAVIHDATRRSAPKRIDEKVRKATDAALDNAWKRVDAEARALRVVEERPAALPRVGGQELVSDARRREASALLRVVDALLHTKIGPRPDSEQAGDVSRHDWQALLRRACQRYRELFRAQTSSWPLCRALILEWAADGRAPSVDEWRLAWVLARHEIERTRGRTHAYARGTLAELFVLAATHLDGDALPPELDVAIQFQRSLLPPARKPKVAARAREKPASGSLSTVEATIFDGAKAEFEQLVRASSNVDGYEAFSAFRDVRRFAMWAKARRPDGPPSSIHRISTELAAWFTVQGTPRYWGPRERR